MSSPFDITVATNTVTLDAKREGIAAFTVKNNTRRRIHAASRLTSQPPDGAKWLTILPPSEGGSADARDFPIDGTQQYQVKVAVPMDATPASYTFKLVVADEVNPDDNFAESPDVQFTVPEIPKPVARPFPWWIVAAVIAVLVVIVIIVLVVINNNKVTADANATATAVALANARATDDAAATATQASLGAAALTATAVAQATQTALSVFVGGWLPVSGGSLDALAITSAGNNLLNISYVGRCPPDQSICFSTPRTFAINGVPFNSSALAAGGSALQLLIRPANSNQLRVDVSSGSLTEVEMFRRRTVRDDVIIQQPFLTLVFHPFDVQQIQLTPTPGS